MTRPCKVLIVGWRAGIGRALDQLEIPFAVWNVGPVKRRMPGVVVRTQPYGNTLERSRTLAEAFADDGPFSHVIAGTEDAVVAASYARRVLGARRSKHTTVTRCHDKLFMKQTLHELGIPMTPFVDGNRIKEPERLLDELGAPIVVKDRKSSGGRGVELLHTGEEAAKSPLRNRLVEQYVNAPEISVESFVVRGEVRFQNVTEYLEKKFVNVVPAALGVDSVAGVRKNLAIVVEPNG